MAVNPHQELIWQGRIHIGDEPGVYGDAQYSGICAEMPITVFKSKFANPTVENFKLILETESLETYDNYPGHSIVVKIHEPDPNQQFHSIEREIANEKFKGSDNNRKELHVIVPQNAGPFKLSISLRCDTTINPGYYDDFVWIKLSILSTNFDFYASLGFPT